MPEVEPWQACALALNFEPDHMERHPESYMAPRHVIFLPESFPSDEVAVNFKKLMEIANANNLQNIRFKNNLAEFAAWCAPVVSDLTGRDIPPKLAALANSAPQAAAMVEAAPADAPAANVEEGMGITTHKIKTKDMPLDAEIAIAKSSALDKTNVQSVWDELVKMASRQDGCLIGEGDLNELQYGSRQDPKIFTKKQLTDRMRGRKNRAKPHQSGTSRAKSPT